MDNGSTDATRKTVDKEIAAGRLPIRYVQEPRRGLSCARNAGIYHSRGDPIVFTDDDCYPASNFIDSAVEVFLDQRVDFFGGRVLLHDPEDYPTTIKTASDAEWIHPNTFVSVGVIHGANMGFRRYVANKIGGFNELLGAGAPLLSAEDIEYVGRASAAGFRGGYFPGPTVSHHHGRKSVDVPKLQKGYDIGRGGFYASMIISSQCRVLYAKQLYWALASSDSSLRRRFHEAIGALIYPFHLLVRKLSGKPPFPGAMLLSKWPPDA